MTDDEIRAHTLEVAAKYQTLLALGRFDEWIELWAEDGILEFPYAPEGRKPVYRGKAEILSYMKNALGRIKIEGIESSRTFAMQDPEISVAEVAIRGQALKTGKPYNQKYVVFFETKNGKLAHYREYWNPLTTIDAYGGRDIWTNGFGSPA